MPLQSDAAYIAQLAIDLAKAMDWCGNIPKLADWSLNAPPILQGVGASIAAAYGGTMPPAYQTTVDTCNAVAAILASPIIKAGGNYPQLWTLQNQAPALATAAVQYGCVASVDAWDTAAGGGIAQVQKSAVLDFVNASNRDGYWPLLDRFWLHAAPDAPHALCGLKSQQFATAMNSPVFTAYREVKFDGVSAYLETGYLASDLPGSNYRTNNAGLGVWVRTAPPGAATAYEIAATLFSRCGVRIGGSQFNGGLNGTANAASSVAPGTWTGSFHVNRLNDPANITLWHNGVKALTTTQAAVSTPRGSFAIGCTKTNATPPVPTSFTLAGVPASWISAGLTDAQILALHNNLQALLTTLGAYP
jgi:hypothetical protein